jgi:hypothetical protein
MMDLQPRWGGWRETGLAIAIYVAVMLVIIQYWPFAEIFR